MAAVGPPEERRWCVSTLAVPVTSVAAAGAAAGSVDGGCHVQSPARPFMGGFRHQTSPITIAGLPPLTADDVE